MLNNPIIDYLVQVLSGLTIIAIDNYFNDRKGK